VFLISFRVKVWKNGVLAASYCPFFQNKILIEYESEVEKAILGVQSK
jgi:hypothetical protein